MRRFVTATIVLALVAALAASPLLAKPHRFNLQQDARINGTELEAGTYRLELNGENEALIYDGKELVTKSRVEVKPLTNGSTRNSVLINQEGEVVEVRLNKQVVVFVR